MTDYDRRLQAAMAELEQTGMWRGNYAPPAFRIQRRMGQEVRPPHYLSFWRVMSGYAIWFAGIWGIIMWTSRWQFQGVPVRAAVFSSLIAGVIFGAILAAYYAYSRGKHGLSRWEDL